VSLLRIACLLLAAAIAAPAGAAEPAKLRFTGMAHDLKSGAFLYREVHDLRVQGSEILDDMTTYFDADGGHIATKTVDYRGNAYVPVFRLVIPALAYEEAVTSNADAIVMTRRTRKEGERSRRVKKKPPMAADAGLINLIRTHFPTLLEGKPFPLKVVAPARLDAFSVRLRRIEDGKLDDKPVIRFRLEHDSPLRLLLEPVELAFDPESQYVREYRGESNIRDPKTGKPYQVRISFSRVQ
jgi:hypothetical protein